MHFAYYCSGHGYGHATRVSAFTSHLLSLQPPPTVHIISSAPKHVFSECLSQGALYRFAEIDPVIVQPLAYHVDRTKSLDVLRAFFEKKDRKVGEEVAWLREARIDCVLSDAAFLACLAAKKSGLPCSLITNFTFDSVYSYLCTELRDVPSHTAQEALYNVSHLANPEPWDVPLSPDDIMPFVDQMHSGYRCSDLLLLLPGYIPIPSFASLPALPSYSWIDPERNSLYPEVLSSLIRDPTSVPLLPSVPFPGGTQQKKSRRVMRAPLIVRHPSPDIYDAEGRKRLLKAIGVPDMLHDTSTKILVVSFGGQIFHKPSSRGSSRNASGTASPRHTRNSSTATILDETLPTAPSIRLTNDHSDNTSKDHCNGNRRSLGDVSQLHIHIPPPLATPSHLWIPGAPPAYKPPTPTFVSSLQFSSIMITPPTPRLEQYVSGFDLDADSKTIPQLLPDSSWIAIVCGVSPQWGRDDGEELPDGFFIAPRDVYMPDLTAVADVLLGKLGYGTVSECVDACTPFVYVPRRLFIEEHGLRLLLDTDGVGVELSRVEYEAGDWSSSVENAWLKGRKAKEKRRREGETSTRRNEGVRMARELVRWVEDWEDASQDSYPSNIESS